MLYPRDELKLGMPSYSFSCQSSHLTSMAREGFDFNACIYHGKSFCSYERLSAQLADLQVYGLCFLLKVLPRSFSGRFKLR